MPHNNYAICNRQLLKCVKTTFIISGDYFTEKHCSVNFIESTVDTPIAGPL